MTAEARIERMHEHRLAMQLAIAERLTLADARDRIARERWAEQDRHLAERRCGTRAPEAAADLSDRWMMRD